MKADLPAGSKGDSVPDHLALALAKVIAVERVLRTFFWSAGGVAVVYFGIAVPIQATAGQETALSVVYQMLVGVNAHVILSYGATGVFYVLWRRERKTRIEAVKRENRRNVRLEKQLDSARSSSGFTE